MPNKINIPGVGKAQLNRKRGIKNINVRLTSAGEVRISAPWIVPTKTVVDFAESKKDWINKNRRQFKKHIWRSADSITPDTELIIYATNKKLPSRNHTTNQLIVHLPETYSIAQKNDYLDKLVKQKQTEYCQKNIISQLNNLSKKTGLRYKEVKVKVLKSRWGSCDSRGKIVLSSYLSSLPSELVNYILIHELAHTKEMNHSAKFWELVGDFEPRYKDYKKKLRAITPAPRPYRQ